jgi:radical SAM superfamily enzyme YgiQ (UPF0313 family)
VDTVDESLLSAMKRAGCWMICYGIESGDDEVLYLNRKGATCEQAKKAVKAAKKVGIKVWGYFMLGLFGDNAKTMERTIRFAEDLRVDIANFAVSAPYPGTEWNRIARRSNWLSDDMVFDQNYAAVVEQPDCPSSLVHDMQKEAYLRWFLSWKGLKLLLCDLRNLGFFIRVAADHIRSIF